MKTCGKYGRRIGPKWNRIYVDGGQYEHVDCTPVRDPHRDAVREAIKNGKLA